MYTRVRAAFMFYKINSLKPPAQTFANLHLISLRHHYEAIKLH